MTVCNKHWSRMIDYLQEREPREFTLPRLARAFGVKVYVVEEWATQLVRDGFVAARRDAETDELLLRIANESDPLQSSRVARKG